VRHRRVPIATDPHARTRRKSGRFHPDRADLAAVEAEIVQRAIVQLAQGGADGPRLPVLLVADIGAACTRNGGAQRPADGVADESRAIGACGFVHFVRRDRAPVRVAKAARRSRLAPPALELVPLVSVVTTRGIVAGGARRQKLGRQRGAPQRDGVALRNGGDRLQFSVRVHGLPLSVR